MSFTPKHEIQKIGRGITPLLIERGYKPEKIKVRERLIKICQDCPLVRECKPTQPIIESRRVWLMFEVYLMVISGFQTSNPLCNQHKKGGIMDIENVIKEELLQTSSR